MKVGTESHKQLFCQQFLDSHLIYEPEQLAWPQLDDQSLERLRGIPFWEEALSTERQAGIMVSAFAETVSDPLIREALALQGQEEARHARLLEFMFKHYDIKVPERPIAPLPANLEADFIDFGYSECLDSFLAFGMFAIVRQAQAVPEPLFKLFDPILHEEARHIVFFVNWMDYLQVQRGRGAKPFRAVNSLWHYGRAVQQLLGIVNQPASDGSGFTATGVTEFATDLTLESFLANCLQANHHRMSEFDPQLLQPELMPKLTAIALRVLKSRPRLRARHQESPAA
jgi:hypothetical protein